MVNGTYIHTSTHQKGMAAMLAVKRPEGCRTTGESEKSNMSTHDLKPRVPKQG